MTHQERRLIVAGTLLIGVSYGLARFAYGLFLPSMREDVGLNSTMAGAIGSGAYVGYCFAIVISALLVERLGARSMAVAAALVAATGMAIISASTSALWLAGAILLAGASTGLASPPMAEAVSRAIATERQGRANTVVNAGTSLGVAISGPVAFIATGQWRIAYAAFAVIALLNAVLLFVSVPRAGTSEACGDTASETAGRRNLGGLWRASAWRVMVASVGMGIASAAYWTFSSEALLTQGQLSQALANSVWILIGISGLVGGLAGDLVNRFGINGVHRATLAALALALLLLALMPSSLSAALGSGALFGASYIMLTGIYLVWGVRLYSDRPAIGLGLPFLMIAAGQIVGSPLAGYLIGHHGYAFCFIAFASIALVTMLIGYMPARGEQADVGSKTTVSSQSATPLQRFYLPAMPPLGLIDKIGRLARRRSGR